MVTSLPLISEGASSEMYLGQRGQRRRRVQGKEKGSVAYNGETRLAAPTAKPTALRPNIIPSTDPVSACHNAPRAKRPSAIRITFFRPNLSARTPANGLATNANKLVQDVMRLLSRVVRGRLDRSEPIDTRVEEITPVLSKNENDELSLMCWCYTYS